MQSGGIYKSVTLIPDLSQTPRPKHMLMTFPHMSKGINMEFNDHIEGGVLAK